jgi:soluble lytic murein transglycosylase-like protein
MNGFPTMASLIVFYAKLLSFDPNVALAVAKVESGLNPKVVGGQGEIGLFQLKPQFVKGVSRQELFNPHLNAIVAIERLKEERKNCVHRGALNYLVCYNMGRTAAKRIRAPEQFSYVIKVTSQANKYKKENMLYGKN